MQIEPLALALFTLWCGGLFSCGRLRAHVSRRLMAAQRPESTSPAGADRSAPYGVAYLFGGVVRAVDVAVWRLCRDGHAAFDGDRPVPARAATKYEVRNAYRHDCFHRLDPFERVVLEVLREGASERCDYDELRLRAAARGFAELNAHVRALEEGEGRALLVPAHARARAADLMLALTALWCSAAFVLCAGFAPSMLPLVLIVSIPVLRVLCDPLPVHTTAGLVVARRARIRVNAQGNIGPIRVTDLERLAVMGPAERDDAVLRVAGRVDPSDWDELDRALAAGPPLLPDSEPDASQRAARAGAEYGSGVP